MSVTQKIIFGPPGVGKSHHVHNKIKKDLNIENEDVFITVFHPEYRYGDFVGKLLPYNENGNITYKYFRGPFLKALAKAYRNILDNQDNNVLLIIDEINRGNSAAIFGNLFQLLDRNENGWSEYSIMISDLEWKEFLKEIGFEEIIKVSSNKKEHIYKKNNDEKINLDGFIEKINEKIKIIQKNKEQKEKFIEHFKEGYLKLPHNFHIVATMNTSDESIYYMDSAFKRRWDWEYLDIDGLSLNSSNNSIDIDNDTWQCLRKYLNDFIKQHVEYAGNNVEDKLFGKYFLKPWEVNYEKLINKVLFHLWDSVFSRNKEPLKELVFNKENQNEENIVTFGDFIKKFDENFNTILKQANCN